MNASNIFKMEFYKNFRDKAWIIITGSLAVVALLTTIIGLSYMKIVTSNSSYGSTSPGSYSGAIVLGPIFFLLLIFGFIAYYAFTLIYPFRLLSSDYSAGTMGLMIASGVKRTTYYFIKIVATILTTLLAQITIWLLPAILVFGLYGSEIMKTMSMAVQTINIWNFIGMAFGGIIALIAMSVSLFFWVILFKGKFWSIFVYFGANMGFGILSGIIKIFFQTTTIAVGSATSSSAGIFNSLIGQTSGIGIFFSFIEIILFGLLGYFKIKKQDL
ncbi:MAG: ABC transporter permease [Streptococcaceae bacterium]|jgi:ABC-type transport system involved in multi-copper enzyme maturation permease subunit|nr:ABC transporter permease [Streptococcaceae bacterium]